MTSIAASQIASELASLTSSALTAPVQLQLGQILSGTVIALLNDTMLRLQTPAGLLDVAADTPLPAGTPVAITVEGSTQQPRIVITPVSGGTRQPLPQPPEAANESSPTQISAGNAATISTLTAPSSSSAADLIESGNPQSAAGPAQPSMQGNLSAGAPTQPAVPTAAPVAPTPNQAAITQAALSTATAIVRDAATSQGSLAALYADLDAAVTTPSASLPPPVLDAARLVLAMRLIMASSENVNAGDVNAALTHAGLTSAVPSSEAPASATATDLGTALIALRQVLKTWVDQQPDTGSAPEPPNASASQISARVNIPMQTYRGAANVPQAPALTLLTTAAPTHEQVTRALSQADPDTKAAPELPNAAAPQVAVRSTASNAPMPPYRGAPDMPQAPAAASLSSTASPREQAIHLLSETDAAIARQTLLRIVSLPGEPAGSNNAQHSNDNATRVMFEIPIATAQGTGVAPMSIERDRSKVNAAEGQMSWLVRFSIDLPEIGPVHARIALTGERATVTLNVERTESAALLTAGLPLLDAGLRGAQLEPGELRCRSGGSNAAGAARPKPPAPGMFVDQAS
jgi:hypothetical protein